MYGLRKLEKKTDEDLRAEYDLRRLRVRKLGPSRRGFGGTLVLLEPEVAEKFPDASAVNEVLRFLIRIAREKKNTSSGDNEGDPSNTAL